MGRTTLAGPEGAGNSRGAVSASCRDRRRRGVRGGGLTAVARTGVGRSRAGACGSREQRAVGLQGMVSWLPSAEGPALPVGDPRGRPAVGRGEIGGFPRSARGRPQLPGRVPDRGFRGQLSGLATSDRVDAGERTIGREGPAFVGAATWGRGGLAMQHGRQRLGMGCGAWRARSGRFLVGIRTGRSAAPRAVGSGAEAFLCAAPSSHTQRRPTERNGSLGFGRLPCRARWGPRLAEPLGRERRMGGRRVLPTRPSGPGKAAGETCFGETTPP